MYLPRRWTSPRGPSSPTSPRGPTSPRAWTGRLRSSWCLRGVFFVGTAAFFFRGLATERSLTRAFLPADPRPAVPSPATDKPPLVLHAGPYKTATTTLQTSFELHRALLLSSSSYAYLGKFSTYSRKTCPPDVPFCVDHAFLAAPTPARLRRFEATLRRLRREGTGALLSAEGLTQLVGRRAPATDGLLRSLAALRDAFDVTVVLNYRRYFEWAVSACNSLQKPRQTRDNYRWPDADTLEDITFARWYAGLYEKGACPTCTYNWAKFFDPAYHPTESVARQYEALLPGVHINLYDLHQEGTVVTNFVCQALPHARDACAALARRDRTAAAPLVLNPTHPARSEYDRLLLGAQRKKMVSTRRRRTVTRHALEAAFPALGARPKLPRVCPDGAALRELRERSVRYERAVYARYFPLPEDAGRREEYLAGLAAAHVAAFEVYVKEQKFCNWDIEWLLEQDKALRKWFKKYPN